MPTTEPETIEQYSIRVAEAWKIGRKKIDDGALLVVAKNDRKLRIEVGYGLEGALTDVTSRRIIDEIITPKFKNGDFAGGISAGVDRIIGVIDGEPLPAPAPRPQQQPRSTPTFSSSSIRSIRLPIIIVLVLGGVFRSVLGRLFGSIVDRRPDRRCGVVLLRIADPLAGSPASSLGLHDVQRQHHRADPAPERRLVRRLQLVQWQLGRLSGSSSDSGGF